MNSRLGHLCGQQDWKCHYCRNIMTRAGVTQATIDEMTPRSKGGMRTLCNQVAACRTCNSLKGDMHYEEFLAYMETQEYSTRLERYNRRHGMTYEERILDYKRRSLERRLQYMQQFMDRRR